MDVLLLNNNKAALKERTRSVSNTANRAFGTRKRNLEAALAITTTFFLLVPGIEGINKAYSQDKVQAAKKDSSRMVITSHAVTDSLMKQVNDMLAARDLGLRATKYVSSFRMPKTDVGTLVLNANGEKITTLQSDEIETLRARGFKSVMGTCFFFWPGGEWVHVFEKAP